MNLTLHAFRIPSISSGVNVSMVVLLRMDISLFGSPGESQVNYTSVNKTMESISGLPSSA
jgi:hypothetical protein